MRDGYVYLESAQCTTKRASFIPYVFEFSALFFFVLPISLIIVLYVLIGIQLRRSSSMHHSSTSTAKNIDPHHHSHQAYLPHCTSSSNHPPTFQFNQHHSNHQPQQQSSKSKGVSTAESSASSSSSSNNKNAKDQYQRTVSLSNASNAQLSRQNASRRSVVKMLGESIENVTFLN